MFKTCQGIRAFDLNPVAGFVIWLVCISCCLLARGLAPLIRQLHLAAHESLVIAFKTTRSCSFLRIQGCTDSSYTYLTQIPSLLSSYSWSTNHFMFCYLEVNFVFLATQRVATGPLLCLCLNLCIYLGVCFQSPASVYFYVRIEITANRVP